MINNRFDSMYDSDCIGPLSLSARSLPRYRLRWRYQVTNVEVYSCESIDCELLKTPQFTLNRYSIAIKTQPTVVSA
jgi:hypothetical protein